MASPQRHRQKQVPLTVFNSEPLAKLAEQRLRQEGIPCFTRSLHGGPGLWGSAYPNLPHALYVHEADEMRARETLDLPPLELAERERQSSVTGPKRDLWLMVVAIAGVALLLGIMVPWLSR